MSASADLAASLQRAGVKSQGTLVLSVRDGTVLEGTGDVDGSGGARVGATIFAMLKDAAGIVRGDAAGTHGEDAEEATRKIPSLSL